MSTFQIAIIGVFILLALLGVVVFAGFGGLSGHGALPQAVIWGTLPAANVNDLIQTINANSAVMSVTYVQKDPATFDQEFSNAVAEGQGPDLIIVDDSRLYQEHNKLVPIGSSISQRQFLDTFVSGASIFLSNGDPLAVPFAVDPLVMYWNKDIFSSAGIARPPKTWADLSVIAPSVIQKTDAGNVTRALLPFGEYSNVSNAKEILSMLLFQAGNDIVDQNADGTVSSVLDRSSQNYQSTTSPAEFVLNFYTDFANPTEVLYTWNKSFSSSLDAFLAGDLAVYFGNASENAAIRLKNPNLNFDVAAVPQEQQTTSVTYGRFYGLAITKGAKNPASALAVINILTSADALAKWTSISNLPPVRNDLLNVLPTDPYLSVFYDAAIQSKAWLDPNSSQSDTVFKNMVESVTTGSENPGSAVSTAKQQLDLLIKNTQ